MQLTFVYQAKVHNVKYKLKIASFLKNFMTTQSRTALECNRQLRIDYIKGPLHK